MNDCNRYLIKDNSNVIEALTALNLLSKDILVLFVMNANEQMIGTLTDGDIRRFLIKKGSLDSNITMVMKKEFVYFQDKIDLLELKEYKKKNLVLIPILDKNKRIVSVVNLKENKTILPIDAILMAGGKGERLRPLTEKIPKPLLKVGGKSIIDYNIDNLISVGVNNISVTVNYLREQIEEHFIHTYKGIKIECVREPEFLGTIGSIKFVKKIVNDAIVVMNSDLFTNVNFEDFYLHFMQNNADMSVAVVPYSVNVPYGIFELVGRNIKGLIEKPTYNYYANAGIYMIKKNFLELIPDNEFFNATDLIELLIKMNKKVIRFPITGYWIDIGNHQEYKKAQEIVKHLQN